MSKEIDVLSWVKHVPQQDVPRLCLWDNGSHTGKGTG